MGERVSTGQKMIYLGQEKMATYHRYYPNLRQRFFTEVIDEGGHSDIHLSFRWLDGYDYTIEDNKRGMLKANRSWNLVSAGRKIASIKTDYSMQQVRKWFIESLVLETTEQSCSFKSGELSSTTEVHLNGQVIARGSRARQSIFSAAYDLRIFGGPESNDRLLVMSFILFNYVHNQ